jgi:hypothetical protein
MHRTMVKAAYHGAFDHASRAHLLDNFGLKDSRRHPVEGIIDHHRPERNAL